MGRPLCTWLATAWIRSGRHAVAWPASSAPVSGWLVEARYGLRREQVSGRRNEREIDWQKAARQRTSPVYGFGSSVGTTESMTHSKPAIIERVPDLFEPAQPHKGYQGGTVSPFVSPLWRFCGEYAAAACRWSELPVPADEAGRALHCLARRLQSLPAWRPVSTWSGGGSVGTIEPMTRTGSPRAWEPKCPKVFADVPAGRRGRQGAATQKKMFRKPMIRLRNSTSRIRQPIAMASPFTAANSQCRMPLVLSG